MATPAEFLSAARKHGFTVTVRRDVLEVSKSFSPGDRDAYVAADGAGSSVLSLAPMVYPGTTWGSDGGSVGGHAALTSGRYYLCKSGVGKRFLTSIRKALA